MFSQVKTTKFKHIENIQDLLSGIKDKPEISVTQHKYPACTVVCYQYADSHTFNTKEALECRGIVFGSGGNIVSRPLHKFFNVGEKESTLVHNIDWAQVIRVMDKTDGSVISLATIDGVKHLKSKKSFTSDKAVAATNFIKNKENYESFHSFCVLNEITPIYEWTSPEHRIVLAYENPNLTLLHIRRNNTGEYLPLSLLKTYSKMYDIPLVKEYDVVNFDIRSYIQRAKTEENIEGWVIQFASGDMVKLKTDWYLSRHKIMTNVRERDIAEAVLDETIDDAKSKLVSEGLSIDKILIIEESVIKKLNSIKSDVKLVYNENKQLNQKDFAIKFKTHQFFGLMMCLYVEKEPDYKDYFKKHLLKEMYGLTYLNFTDSKAEID